MTKCDQIWGIQKKQDFVKCLKINNLQSRRTKADPGEFEGVRPLNQYSAKGTKKASLAAMLFVCLGRESNPHGHYCPRDFKSLVSTISPPRLCVRLGRRGLNSDTGAKVVKIGQFAYLRPHEKDTAPPGHAARGSRHRATCLQRTHRTEHCGPL